ncbi:hypothetical protein B0H14DRAFT_3733470 [Mycena olivaceomarginata]|nr:hypothetical protein B0H14DRAFT_3733470 [Mycena olivaceomarginata]
MGKFADSYLESRIRLVREVFNPSIDKLGLLAECPMLEFRVLRSLSPRPQPGTTSGDNKVVFEISWQFGYVFEDPAQAWGDETSRNQSPSFPRSCGECGSQRVLIRNTERPYPSGSSQPVVGKTFALGYTTAAKFHALPIQRDDVEGLEYIAKVEPNYLLTCVPLDTYFPPEYTLVFRDLVQPVAFHRSKRTESVWGTMKPQQRKEAGDEVEYNGKNRDEETHARESVLKNSHWMETGVLWLCGAPFLPAGGEIDGDKGQEDIALLASADRRRAFRLIVTRRAVSARYMKTDETSCSGLT